MRQAALPVALLPALLLAACVSERERAQDTENLLAAAGFDAVPATTADRQQEMASLPPNQLLSRVQGDKLVYFYADPLVCNCLYIGNQAAYGRYRAEMFQRQIVDQQRLAAQSYENAAWNWGPWGSGWWRP